MQAVFGRALPRGLCGGSYRFENTNRGMGTPPPRKLILSALSKTSLKREFANVVRLVNLALRSIQGED